MTEWCLQVFPEIFFNIFRVLGSTLVPLGQLFIVIVGFLDQISKVKCISNVIHVDGNPKKSFIIFKTMTSVCRGYLGVGVL